MTGPGTHHVLTPNPTLISPQNLDCHSILENNRCGWKHIWKQTRQEASQPRGEAAPAAGVRGKGPGPGGRGGRPAWVLAGPLPRSQPGPASRWWHTFPPISQALFCLYCMVSLSIIDGNEIGLEWFPLPTVFLVPYWQMTCKYNILTDRKIKRIYPFNVCGFYFLF